MRRKITQVLTVVISLGLAVVLAEVVLQLVKYPKPVTSGWKTLNGYKSERHQLGFRGQPIEYGDDDFVIVLVGDSQVEAKACAYGWMPEQRLQSYLSSSGRRVRVFSLGGPGTGQDQQLLSLREYYQKFRADMVVVWLTPANDIWNNTFPSAIPDDRTPKPTFWLEGAQLRGPTELTGEPVRETSGIKLVRLWRKLFPWSREREWARNILPAPYAPLNSYDGPAADEWQKRMDLLPGYLRYENFDTDKNDRALYLSPRSPRVQYGLDLTRRLLEEMRQLAASRGAQFAIFTTGTRPAVAGSDEVVQALNGKYYKTSESLYYQNLDYITRGFNFHLIPVTVVPPTVGPEDAHLNEHATDQVIRDLAAAIRHQVPAGR